MYMRFFLCLSILCLTSCGGGPKLTKVSGNLKYKDKPVSNATITFSPDGAGTVGAATTDSSGNYALGSTLGSGVPAGSYSVSIKSQVKPVVDSNPMAGLTPGSKEYEEAYMKVSSSSRDPKSYKVKSDSDAIPEKYASGSEIKKIVEPTDTQVIDFDLK